MDLKKRIKQAELEASLNEASEIPKENRNYHMRSIKLLTILSFILGLTIAAYDYKYRELESKYYQETSIINTHGEQIIPANYSRSITTDPLDSCYGLIISLGNQLSCMPI